MAMSVANPVNLVDDEPVATTVGIEVTPVQSENSRRPTIEVRYRKEGTFQSDEVWEADQLPPWIVDTLKELGEIGQLPCNWDSYGARPIAPETLKFSVQMLRAIERDELPVPHVTAGSSGSVGFEWHFNGRELEVEFLNSELAEYLQVYPDGAMNEGKIASNFPDELRRLVRWLLRG